MTEQQAKGAPKGPGSFCVPRAAIEALLDAKATAYEICAYLVLARFTDGTGCCSTASISAVNRYTGANKVKGGPVDRAIERLKLIRAKTIKKISNGRNGKAHQWIEQATDLGPILSDRAAWLEKNLADPLPDGPHERTKVLFVLHNFGEDIDSRVWFSNNLVDGFGEFRRPLKVLKDTGPEAARLLLAMYAANDMEQWGGVRPIGAGSGPWNRYTPEDAGADLPGGGRLITWKETGHLAVIDARICGPNLTTPYFAALTALLSTGLVYEVVMVLNRNYKTAEFKDGSLYTAIPDDAEPLYELGARNHHGHKPEGEEGIGGATAKTAGELGKPVTLKGGTFHGTYAAIVRRGQGAMIVGIYRLRFRPANKKNAGVSSTWSRIHQSNREAFDFLQAIRVANHLPELPPLSTGKPPAPAAAVATGSA